MKKSNLLCILCALFFSFFCSQALADTKWEDAPLIDWPWLPDSPNKIDEITQNVTDIRNDVTGNAKEVADNFKEQLDDLVAKGLILRESVEDLLTWLLSRQGPYREFVGDSPRCNSFTTCHQFRLDLSNFFMGIADQGANFPAIEKAGLDGSRAVDIIMRTPPIILFGLYEAMNRIPDWTEMPANLQSIFDEIGDRDVFSIRLEENEESATASTPQVAAMAIGSRTPTQRFCDRWERRVDKEMDPVRLNRIQFFVYYMRSVFGIVESLTSETIGADIAGEGNETLIPNPLKAQLKIVLFVFDVIQRGAQTFRDNLGVCRANRREIEIQVAQCIELVDFILPSRRDDVYMFVQTKVVNAGGEGVPVVRAERSLEAAEDFRSAGKWKQAYLKLCDAYRQIGE
ncbi:MAG: hypothetical protein OEU74_02500 [Gammaproteobacteria bacterium]|nr:hypothetical protein [Gammaproteobacteria bacterium]